MVSLSTSTLFSSTVYNHSSRSPTFGDSDARNSPHVQIRHGEAVGIIGPSGTGKSTVLKIMAGLLSPDKGEVYIRGRTRQGLISDDELSGLRIGLVFQSAALFYSLTVGENVGFLLYENSSLSDDQISMRVSENLAAVGLKVLFHCTTVVEDLIRSVHMKGGKIHPGKIHGLGSNCH